MFKLIVVILLCFVLLLQPVHTLLIVLNYAINKEFISTVLCINRDKPELNCEGKCQVTEKFKEQEKKKNEQKGTFSNKVDIPLDLPASIENLFPPTVENEYHIIYKRHKPSIPPFSIFHPPKAPTT